MSYMVAEINAKNTNEQANQISTIFDIDNFHDIC